ncbi:MAG: cob(I)yrinic acid a,c-diamide adenosyltransferase [Clostridia bacterium]|nr:cob(I)yrinic acid a,c-diamide adenosyltransferase [Clostridia bacterium]MDE7328500.1 cob(I)yrinic acid a,c-diamide adenosyltransferase [Clostridia bacterium]
MIHIYYGEGKGKTTAAMGLALRALGQGLNVTIAQFLKDGKSGEIEPLKKLGATIICDTQPMPFTWQMNETNGKRLASVCKTCLKGQCNRRRIAI